jgi:hypothetical protein
MPNLVTKNKMGKIIILSILIAVVLSCKEKEENSSINPVNWEKRKIIYPLSDSLEQGSTYLPVYSQIYSQTEHKTHDLTVTISMRNANENDSLFIESAKYYDTDGSLIRTYFDKPIYLTPMETIEIVIDEKDNEGGSGANFIFNWRANAQLTEPLFESVMISTYGQQGISFLTQGIRIK